MPPLLPRIQDVFLARARRLGFAATEFDVMGVLWECEVKRDAGECAKRVKDALAA